MIDRPIRPLWPKGFRNEVQVICTVLSADLVTPHDILCINGASAALMISPLPFFGPVGAVRVGLHRRRARRQPDARRRLEEESALDLIVVGTKDGLTMVEAGAEEVPEDDAARGARARAPARSASSARRRRTCARQVGKAKWLDPELTAELETAHGDTDLGAHPDDGPARGAAAIVEELETSWLRT